jgi:hypothetical protein
MRRLAGILSIGTLAFLCSCSEGTTTTTRTTTAPTLTTTAPDRSTLAEDCIIVVRKAGRQLDDLLQGHDPSNIDPVEAIKLQDQLRQVGVALKDGADSVRSELGRLGAVAGGDECLYRSATLLAVIKDALPPGTQDHAIAAELERVYYSVLLVHYPDSRYSDKVREALVE